MSLRAAAMKSPAAILEVRRHSSRLAPEAQAAKTSAHPGVTSRVLAIPCLSSTERRNSASPTACLASLASTGERGCAVPSLSSVRNIDAHPANSEGVRPSASAERHV